MLVKTSIVFLFFCCFFFLFFFSLFFIYNINYRNFTLVSYYYSLSTNLFLCIIIHSIEYFLNHLNNFFAKIKILKSILKNLLLMMTPSVRGKNLRIIVFFFLYGNGFYLEFFKSFRFFFRIFKFD